MDRCSMRRYTFPGAMLFSSSVFLVFTLTKSSETHDYCLHESFNATCRPGEVILMTSAHYGRMKAGRCISADYGHMGCSSSVIGYLDQKCSGRRACSVNVRDLVDVKPCKKDFMSYLQAHYQCVEVQLQRNECQKHVGYQRITGAYGYLTTVGITTGHGGIAACPWVVKAGPGQNLNFTFIDLGTATPPVEVSGAYNMLYPCSVSITYTELGEMKQLRICDKKSRERHLYVTRSNSVKMEVTVTVSSGKPDFLIKYEVIGCADPMAPKDTWLERMGDKTVVRCNSSDEIWYLTCQGTTWVGELGNCSRQLISFQTISEQTPEKLDGISSHGISLAVLIGVALGLLIGTTLLTVVLCLRKSRRKTSHGQKPSFLNRSRDHVASLHAPVHLPVKELDKAFESQICPRIPEEVLCDHYSATLRKIRVPPEDLCDYHCHNQRAPRTLTDENSVCNEEREKLTSHENSDTDVSLYPPGMRTPERLDTAKIYIPLNNLGRPQCVHGNVLVHICND